MLATRSGPQKPSHAKSGAVRLLGNRLLLVSNGFEELLTHIPALAVRHDGVLGADEIFEVPPGRAGGVVVQPDLLARLHLHLRQHVLESGAGQNLADGERQLDHIPVDDELEGPLLPAGGPDCDESLHREAAVFGGEPTLQVLHVLEESHIPRGRRKGAHPSETTGRIKGGKLLLTLLNLL